MNRRSLLGLGAATVLGVGAVSAAGTWGFAQEGTPAADGEDACASPVASPAASSDMGMASPEASPAADACAAGEFVVHTVDIGFEPKELTIPANTDVVVTIDNKGKLQHDFYIDELGVESDLLDGGTSGTVTINAAPGTYEFYCSVVGHKQAGMVGTLTVE